MDYLLKGPVAIISHSVLKISLVLSALSFRIKFRVDIRGNLSIPVLMGWKQLVVNLLQTVQGVE